MKLLPLLLLACEPTKNNTKDSGQVVDSSSQIDSADTSDTEDTEDTEDTGESVDPQTPVDWNWTEGPELPACTPQTGSSSTVALSGVLLTLDGPSQGLVVYDSSAGEITCVGSDCDTTDATVVCTEGIITPGLVDAHNHMQYNALGPWRHEDLYENRYEWRSDGRYWDYREAYDDLDDSGLLCEVGRWAELRTLSGGGTSVVGSSGGSCIAGMVRNLDESSVAHDLDNYDLYYSASTVTDRWDESDAIRYTEDLESGEVNGVMNHVAEGINGSSRYEIDHMLDIGMAGPGMVFVHSTDASTEQLARMAIEGTSILWSPRSNLDLYAATTNADIALRLGVDVALGPDWTWSGSSNPMRELRCAAEYLQSRNTTLSDQDIWAMGTVDAARLIGLDGILGILEPGAKADIAVFPYSETPYRPIIEAAPEGIHLLIIDGKALMGTTDLMGELAEDESLCEVITACENDRMFCVKDNSNDDGYTDLENTLSSAIALTTMPSELEYAGELFGVFQCSDERLSCDYSSVAEDDSDGDGILDSEDLCVYAYNPQQLDHDEDGTADACDPCPLVPNSSSCTHDPSDIDDDGYLNEVDNCMTFNNPDQNDSDDDGSGDECDSCPEFPNPENGPCPYTIRDLRDPNAPNHPVEGSQVVVTGAVVTSNRTGYGYVVQDPNETEFGGLFVYSQNLPDVSLGTVLTIEGTYVEYYGLTEITNPIVSSTGLVSPPEPILISNICDIGTGGVLAENYESMLVTIGSSTVTNINPDSPDDYQEFEVENCLRVDDMLCPTCWTDQPSINSTFSQITGVVAYTYSNHKLLPRSSDDIVE